MKTAVLFLLKLVETLILFNVTNAADKRFPVADQSFEILERRRSDTLSTCIQDYSPCNCDVGIDSIIVVCVNTSAAEIQNVFKTTNDLQVFAFYMESTSPSTLPFDFLANKRVLNIALLSQVFTFPRPSLIIDSSAFRFTRRNTVTFRIENWDLESQQDFSFLTDFEVLKELYIHRNANITGFQSLPGLPALTDLYILSCPSLTDVAFPDLTPAKLERLVVASSGLGDGDTSNILISVGTSSSANSIEQLDFNDNRLTSIPRQFRSFVKLSALNLSRNKIATIPKYSLIFTTTPVISIDLSYNGVTSIETGAFEGDFKAAVINLQANDLTLFEEDVFKVMLQQMTSQPIDSMGYVDIKSNPFECGCDIAWLVRDNRNLLLALRNGTCADSTAFEELDPSFFSNCP